MIEKEIAYHLAPALAGIKSANLVSLCKKKFSAIHREIKDLNEQLNCRGIYFEILCECEKRIGIREPNSHDFQSKISCNTALKCSLIQKGLTALLPCLTKKFCTENSSTLHAGKFIVFLLRRTRQGLPPCKDDNAKRQKFNKCKACVVRLSYAYL